MKCIHKYTNSYNGYTWSLCGIPYVSRSKASITKLTKIWNDITCKNCLKKKEAIKKKLLKALKNLG